MSKGWALDRLSEYRTISVLPTLEFDLSFNSGFSFSTGSGQGRLIGFAVIGLSIFIVRQIMRESQRLRTVLLSVILGGALGNLWDRVFRAESGVLSGHVVDFIDVSWFAVFNVADIFVVGGAVLFGATELLSNQQQEAPHKPEEKV